MLLGDEAYRWGAKKKWSREEHDRLMELVSCSTADPSFANGVKWPDIAKLLGTGRTAKQCRERWLNARPDAKKGDWSVEEEEVLARLHADIGPAWSKMMYDHLHHRSENAIKNHFNALMRCKTLNSRPETLLSIYVAFLRDGVAGCKALQYSLEIMSDRHSAAQRGETRPLLTYMVRQYLEERNEYRPPEPQLPDESMHKAAAKIRSIPNPMGPASTTAATHTLPSLPTSALSQQALPGPQFFQPLPPYDAHATLTLPGQHSGFVGGCKVPGGQMQQHAMEQGLPGRVSGDSSLTLVPSSTADQAGSMFPAIKQELAVGVQLPSGVVAAGPAVGGAAQRSTFPQLAGTLQYYSANLATEMAELDPTGVVVAVPGEQQVVRQRIARVSNGAVLPASQAVVSEAGMVHAVTVGDRQCLRVSVGRDGHMEGSITVQPASPPGQRNSCNSSSHTARVDASPQGATGITALSMPVMPDSATQMTGAGRVGAASQATASGPRSSQPANVAQQQSVSGSFLAQLMQQPGKRKLEPACNALGIAKSAPAPLCHCQLPALMNISNLPDSAGRVYYACCKAPGDPTRCRFLLWDGDGDSPAHARDSRDRVPDKRPRMAEAGYEESGDTTVGTVQRLPVMNWGEHQMQPMQQLQQQPGAVPQVAQGQVQQPAATMKQQVVLQPVPGQPGMWQPMLVMDVPSADTQPTAWQPAPSMQPAAPVYSQPVSLSGMSGPQSGVMMGFQQMPAGVTMSASAPGMPMPMAMSTTMAPQPPQQQVVYSQPMQPTWNQGPTAALAGAPPPPGAQPYLSPGATIVYVPPGAAWPAAS